MSEIQCMMYYIFIESMCQNVELIKPSTIFQSWLCQGSPSPKNAEALHTQSHIKHKLLSRQQLHFPASSNVTSQFNETSSRTRGQQSIRLTSRKKSISESKNLKRHKQTRSSTNLIVSIAKKPRQSIHPSDVLIERQNGQLKSSIGMYQRIKKNSIINGSTTKAIVSNTSLLTSERQIQGQSSFSRNLLSIPPLVLSCRKKPSIQLKVDTEAVESVKPRKESFAMSKIRDKLIGRDYGNAVPVNIVSQKVIINPENEDQRVNLSVRQPKSHNIIPQKQIQQRISRESSYKLKKESLSKSKKERKVSGELEMYWHRYQSMKCRGCGAQCVCRQEDLSEGYRVIACGGQSFMAKTHNDSQYEASYGARDQIVSGKSSYYTPNHRQFIQNNGLQQMSDQSSVTLRRLDDEARSVYSMMDSKEESIQLVIDQSVILIDFFADDPRITNEDQDEFPSYL